MKEKLLDISFAAVERFQLKVMEELTDTSRMPFGRHKGTLLQDVPASYLHWLWTNGDRNTAICRYIAKNLEALKKEFPDGIWT